MAKKRIYLSPSTQEKNVGAGSYGTEEARMNQLTNIIEEQLLAYDNLMFKRNKATMNLPAVVRDSNNYYPDLHLAIHTNADTGKARGCEVFCYDNKSKGYPIAKTFYKNISEITPTSDRGVKFGKNFYGPGKSMYELEKTKSVAILIEIIFHDNKDDAKWFIDNIDLIASTIVRSIAEVFSLEKTTIPKWEAILRKASPIWWEKYKKEILKSKLNWKGLIEIISKQGGDKK